MKALWNKIIAWFMYRKIKRLQTAERSGMDKHYRIDTSHSHTLDSGEEVISIKRDNIQDFIDQKKNRKPFYKDDNKKDWE